MAGIKHNAILYLVRYLTLCVAFLSVVISKSTGAVTTPSDICKLPAETGLCFAAFPKWFFNATSGQCEEFIYGGCRGNENNFPTERECINQCATRHNGS